MAWALDLDWVRAAGRDDVEEGEDGVVKNVLQVANLVLCCNSRCIQITHLNGCVYAQVPHEISTIQEALDTSKDGDTIAIAPGYYNERFGLSRVCGLMPFVLFSVTYIMCDQSASPNGCHNPL